VIHRDVKPANVLRTGVHALVADFGVAKALSASLPAVGMTTSGMAIGTPQYMAPEQLAGDPAADHRVDIYALGLLGYELLTGAPTFSGPSPQATLAAQLTRNPAPLKLQRPDAPEGLSRLLMRCLAKDPGARPATAPAVRAELEEIVMPSGDYIPGVPIIASRSRSMVPFAIGGLVLLAAVAALATQIVTGAPAQLDTATVAPPRPPVVAVDSSAALVTPPPAVSTSVPLSNGDSSGGRRQTVTAETPPRTGRVGARGSGAAGVRLGAAADSLAALTLLLRTQSPPDHVVRQPSPNSVSAAALEERRNNMGPPRKAWLVASADSLSRAMVGRLARVLDASRYQVSVEQNPVSANSDGALDSLALARGYDILVHAQAPMRRDSSYTGVLRLRDLTANTSYSSGAASRRMPRDSVEIAMDTIAAQAVRRLSTMDRAPRAGVVDPEVRAFEDRASNMGPARRVVIWNHPPHDNLRVQDAGSQVMDGLRAAVRGLSRFNQVPRDSTLDLLARSRNRETVLATLNADLMVSIAGSFTSAAMVSVTWSITVRDVGAASQYQDRSFRSAPAPLDAPLTFAAATLSRVLAAMEQMDAAPRRPNGPAR
jgi:hypothetical protein